MLKALGTREARAMPGTRRKTHWRPGSDSVRSPSEDVDPNAASLAVLEAAAAPSNQAEPAVWIPEKSLIGCQPSTKGRPQRCLRRLQVTRRSCDPVPRPFDDLESAAAPLAVLAADTAATLEEVRTEARQAAEAARAANTERAWRRWLTPSTVPSPPRSFSRCRTRDGQRGH